MISSEINIFLAQFIMIMLLGLQSINVNRGDKVMAAITSFLLGICGFYVTGSVAKAYVDGIMSSVFVAYLIAGPLGIVTSMYMYPVIRNFFNKKDM